MVFEWPRRTVSVTVSVCLVLFFVPAVLFAEGEATSSADASSAVGGGSATPADQKPDMGDGVMPSPAEPAAAASIATATPASSAPRPVSNPAPAVSAPAVSENPNPEATMPSPEEPAASFPYAAVLLGAATTLLAGFGLFKVFGAANTTGSVQSVNCDEIKKQLETKRAEKESLEAQIAAHESAVELAERKLKEAAEKKINEKKDVLVKDIKNRVKTGLFGKEGALRNQVEKGESVYATYQDLEQKFENAKKLLALLRQKHDALLAATNTLESSYAVCVVGADALSAGVLLKKTGIPEIIFDRLHIEPYAAPYQKQVKQLVTLVHEEYGFAYDASLDADLEAPDKTYVETGGMFALLLDGATVAGTVAVKKIDSETAELKRLYLLKKYRGHGWGTKLLTVALEYCRKQHFKRCILDTTRTQTEAQALYRKNGFTEYKTEGETIYFSRDIQNV